MNYKNFVFFIFLISTSCNQQNQSNTLFDDWKSTNIQSISSLELKTGNEDLSNVKDIIANAQVVCLGESRHDISEQFKLKNRLVRYLIEELGFRAFTLEASLPYSIRLNNYLRTGNGNLDQIMAEMPGWFLWDTQELKELFIWIREFNAQTNDKVLFYGFDIVAPNNAYEQVFDYLKTVDEAKYNQIGADDFGREIINDNHWPSTLEQFAAISEERKLRINENISQLYWDIEKEEGNYTNKSSEQEYQWILKLTYSIREAIRMFSTNDRIRMGLIRDSAMANICSWIIGDDRKTIIWAHNVHIAKSEFTMSTFPNQKIKGMGALLGEVYKDKLVSIGGTFGKGEFQNEGRNFPVPDESTIDGTLARLGIDIFIVDITQPANKTNLKKWLYDEKAMIGQEFEMFCAPVNAFDAFYFTNNVSKVHYNATTIERMGNP